MACRPALQDVTDNTDIVEFFDTLWLLELIDGRYVSIALEIVFVSFIDCSLNSLKVGIDWLKELTFLRYNHKRNELLKLASSFELCFNLSTEGGIFFPVSWYPSYAQVFNNNLSRFYTLDKD